MASTMATTLVLLISATRASCWVTPPQRHYRPRAAPRIMMSFLEPPVDPNAQPSILEVARPLMDSAKALEACGISVIGLASGDQDLFQGGSSIVNVARDLEDAGSLARMRPGIFAEGCYLKIRGLSTLALS